MRHDIVFRLGSAGVLAMALAAAGLPALGSYGLQSSEANARYQEGRRALDREAWEEAIMAFEEASEDENLADAALYWQAYAERRRGDLDRALGLAAELERSFPESRWQDDARALAAEIRGVPGGASGADEELKLIALNALMQADDETAVPILEELLQSDQSTRVKERALFVLAQSESDRAQEILSRVARADSIPELQMKAIRYLGVHAGGRGLSLLSELYASLESVEMRESVLQSFMIAGEKQKLLDVAREEASPELRRNAIHLLGAMDATEELWDLYGREASADVREQILQAFMMSGDEAHLLAVARNPSEETELRKTAIHQLGVSGDSARPALLEIYRSENDAALKEQVLHALFLQDAVAELIELARTEENPELVERAVHGLSLMDSEEARSFMMEILRR